MRVLLLTSDWPPPGPAVRRDAESLQAAGHHVDVFACRGRGLYTYLAAWTQLRPRLHPGRYDVVHAQDRDAVLALPKRVPLVMTVQQLRFGTRLLAGRADAVLVPSHEIAAQLGRCRTVHLLSPQFDESARLTRLLEVYRSVLRAP